MGEDGPPKTVFANGGEGGEMKTGGAIMPLHELRLLRLLPPLALAAWAFACGESPTAVVSPAELTRAQETLQPFKEELLAALMGSLEEGPAHSIHVCRERAPQIAAALSVDGVEMGRTSHRLRNPANAPAAWVEPLLAGYVEDPEQVEPRAVYLRDGRIGYVEPIRVIHLCVSCHGPSVEPELLAEVRSLYPEDQATGFRVGDLRGLFWVTLPASEG